MDQKNNPNISGQKAEGQPNTTPPADSTVPQEPQSVTPPNIVPQAPVETPPNLSTPSKASETPPANPQSLPPQPSVPPLAEETPAQINQELSAPPGLTSPEQPTTVPAAPTVPTLGNNQETQAVAAPANPPIPAQPQGQLNYDEVGNNTSFSKASATTPEVLAEQLPQTPTGKDASATVSALNKLKADSLNSKQNLPPLA